ncbi:MAG: hypothetical protein E6R03_03275 [Hyphomicrobiaceae bacterium]|nr:MAG: hypothetical protein E6R03_03275 [Hyphomicrobiaceae bacterium]
MALDMEVEFKRPDLIIIRVRRDAETSRGGWSESLHLRSIAEVREFADTIDQKLFEHLATKVTDEAK